MVPQNCSVSHILQNIFLCVQQNKDIHTGLELLEGESMVTEFSFFGWTIPLTGLTFQWFCSYFFNFSAKKLFRAQVYVIFIFSLW